MRTINSMLPDYGQIDIELYDFTEKIYDFLNREKINEIDRLKKLNQLGLISEVYERTHHSKWEYIIIQFYLSQLLRNNEKTTGLGSNIKLKTGKSISVIDLINSWAILLNIGHLQRAFSCERYWFDEILKDKNLQIYISKELGQRIFQNKFSDMLKREDFFSFYSIISVLFIKKKLMKKSKEISEDMLDLLELWFKKDPRKSVKNAKKIFKKIRYFSFIYLDTNNSHTCFKIQTTLFFNHMKSHVNEVIFDDDHELNIAFNDIEKILFNNVYSSIDFKLCLANYLKKRKKLISQKIKLKQKEKRKGLKPEEKFLRTLFSVRENDISQRWSNEEWDHLIRFDFQNDFLFREDCKYHTEEIELNKIKDIYFLVESIKSDDLNSSVIDVFTKNAVKHEDVRKVATKIKNYINKYFESEPYDIFFMGLEKIIEELLIFCIKSHINPNYKIRFIQDSPSNIFNFCYIGTKSKIKPIIKELLKITKNSNLKKDRKHEISTIINLIRDFNFDGTTILPLKTVQIYDDKWNSIAELDGMAVNISNNKIKVILTEAKSGRSSSKQALKELLEKIEKLRLSNCKTPYRTRKRTGGYAYSILKL